MMMMMMRLPVEQVPQVKQVLAPLGGGGEEEDVTKSSLLLSPSVTRSNHHRYSCCCRFVHCRRESNNKNNTTDDDDCKSHRAKQRIRKMIHFEIHLHSQLSMIRIMIVLLLVLSSISSSCPTTAFQIPQTTTTRTSTTTRTPPTPHLNSVPMDALPDGITTTTTTTTTPVDTTVTSSSSSTTSSTTSSSITGGTTVSTSTIRKRSNRTKTTTTTTKKKIQQNMELIWCDATSVCMSGEEYLREMVLRNDPMDQQEYQNNNNNNNNNNNHNHEHSSNHDNNDNDDDHPITTSNQIVYRGPATGQVAYHWIHEEIDMTTSSSSSSRTGTTPNNNNNPVNDHIVALPLLPQHCILFLIKQGSDMEQLCTICVAAIRQLITTHQNNNNNNIHFVLDHETYPMIRQQLRSAAAVASAAATSTNVVVDDNDNSVHLRNTTVTGTENVVVASGTGGIDHLDLDLDEEEELMNERIHLLDDSVTICRGFGTENISTLDIAETEFGMISSTFSTATSSKNHHHPNGGGGDDDDDDDDDATTTIQPYVPNLIVTLGGDGLLMHAGMLFQGPMPPVLCIAGGSLGFLTPFAPHEMVSAIEIALRLTIPSSTTNDGTVREHDSQSVTTKKTNAMTSPLQIFPPNMAGYDDDDDDDENNGDAVNDRYINGIRGYNKDKFPNKFTLGLGDCICLSIRMRLDCRIMDSNGIVRARYNVLNEVVIDRGSSPYLAALECFCDDAHLTTVQADGVIFATPTGSTAYSLAAGSSVVHPAVPCILVTPICPHVLSFRSMVFPDHVILRCYVPHDARAEASVAFDGKHRQELHRGDSVQIRMSAYPVPTINRQDHSADWLSSLKRNFNFNARPRQRPL